MAKRLFDIFASAAGLVLIAPLLALIALGIKLDSRGPVIFMQQRVGRNGRLFHIHKFRTMVEAAPTLGPAVTSNRDLRITRLGRVLRKYKLDELPQLLDVLRGAMSLVGPRPEVAEFVQLYPQQWRAEILSVRPGITDETSLRFRSESELLADSDDPREKYIAEILPKKIELNLQYIRTRTFWGDVRILLRTAKALVRG